MGQHVRYGVFTLSHIVRRTLFDGFLGQICATKSWEPVPFYC